MNKSKRILNYNTVEKRTKQERNESKQTNTRRQKKKII